MSEPFSDYMRAKERTTTARVQRDYADTLLEKRLMEQRMCELISQHEPAFSLGIDRKKLAVALFYVRTGRLPEAEHGES